MGIESGRRDGDAWDLASGVGATATAVAASRALATRDGLLDDQWGERSHVTRYLEGRGWHVSARLVHEVSEEYGIEHVEDEMAVGFEDFQYVSAGLG